MNPDVAAAVDALEKSGTLTAARARHLGRVARGELVSLRDELRLLAYAGVLLATAGVALLVKENLERIGPLAIASALALAAAVCLGWVARRAAPFTWGEVASPHLALDYVLLLGALLVGADLAYVEARFTALGESWPLHLLLVSGIYALLAFRYDSRVLLSVALSTFAAWRGVSAARLHGALWTSGEDGVRANAAACGVAFLLIGAALRAGRRKAHFEPVATHGGWLLLLGAVASALGTPAGSAWALVLLALATAVAAIGLRQRRFSLIAIAVIAGYAGVSGLLVRAVHADLGLFWWFAITPLLVVGLLFLAHRRVQEPE